MFDPIWFHLVPVRVFFLVWSSLGCGFPFSRGRLVKRDAKACMSRHRAWVLFRFFRGDAKSLAWVPRWLVKREAKACMRRHPVLWIPYCFNLAPSSFSFPPQETESLPSAVHPGPIQEDKDGG